MTSKPLAPVTDAKCSGGLFQAARIIDVVLLGPIMIKAGRQIGGAAGTFLAVSGVLTILFNGATFLEIERKD